MAGMEGTTAIRAATTDERSKGGRPGRSSGPGRWIRRRVNAIPWAAVANAAHGRAVLRAYLNLRERPSSPARAVFDATMRTGAAILLAERIRRYGSLSYRVMRGFAEASGITESDLRLVLMPLLRSEGLIDYATPGTEPDEITEQVGVAAPLLEQCDALWEACGPALKESTAIQCAELGAVAPMARSDHQGALEAAGFAEAMHADAIVAAEGAGLLYRQPSSVLGEDVLFSPYVWSTEAVDVAEFIGRLPVNERELLMKVSEKTLQRPGLSEEDLGVSDSLLRGARRVGLIDATRVQTTHAAEHSFVFSPMLERQLAVGSTEVTHQRKLFTAHILYGHRYGRPGTGRIDDPLALVGALVRNGTIAPSTAAATDYLLLEAAGIVRVEKTGNLGRLYLVKDEVARDSLDLLRLAVGGDEFGPHGEVHLPGSKAFITPERDRAALPAIQPGAEAEALHSSVEYLREELGRKFRGEDF